MKSIFYALVMVLTITQGNTQNSPANFISISGEITHPNSDSLTIFNRARTFSKTIRVNDKGVFKDTLKVLPEEQEYLFYDGREGTVIYLRNGYDIAIRFDGKALKKTLTFYGKGGAENNYITSYELKKAKEVSFVGLDKETYRLKVNERLDRHVTFLESYPDLPSEFINERKASLEKERTYRLEYLEKDYIDSYQSLFDKYEASTADHLKRGKPSPKFVDYRNFEGGTTSLDDFKGQYVYIDVWATWCSPCKREIPFLEAFEKEYHDKNIAFVSISIDREKDYAYWRQMITDKNMEGIQLIADKDFKSEFIKEYRAMGVPRFILLDPQGNIVDSHAPRPSKKYLLKQLLDSLDL